MASHNPVREADFIGLSGRRKGAEIDVGKADVEEDPIEGCLGGEIESSLGAIVGDAR